ncbi:MFS transporter [Mucilaginibacter sp. AW1-3]
MTSNSSDHKYVHPIAFMFLILPYGIVSGYVTVTLGFLYSKAGISLDHVAALAGASILPAIVSFLWAPLVDTTLSVKRWYLLAAVTAGLGILITGILPIKESSLPFLIPIVILTAFASSFVSITTNSMMAYDTPEDMKGRAGGYLQAGNLGGAGLGGGVGLLLAHHLNSGWIPGAVVGAVCALSCLGLFFVKEPKVTIRAEKLGRSFVNLLKDLWAMIRSRAGYLALFLCLLPIGTGSAANLWAAVAKSWSAGADVVALATGLASGGITALGCLLGGWICDRIDRKMAYVLFGLLAGVCTVSMALTPHTEMMYIVWTSTYAITTGLAYAGYTAFVLEAIGKGAAGTKVSVFTALSNSPIYAMTIIEGWAYTKWGANGMLYTEAVAGAVAVSLFLIVQAVVNRKKIIA